MKFLLFGTGDYYERYKKWFNKNDILALLDNSPDKQHILIDGIKVLSPEEGIKLPFDVIVILSFYVKEMRLQLVELGVTECKIYHFYDLHRLIYRRENKKAIQYYGDAERVLASENKTDKKALLLSHDLTLGGPSIALFHAAKVLMGQGYQVVYASMLDGPLRHGLLSNHVPVIVDVNLQIETMEDAEWTNGFTLIICNTINFHVFLSKRDARIPVIWWLHDASFFYDGIQPELLRRMDRTNLTICAVGPIPKAAFQAHIPRVRVKNLLYGVEDFGNPEKRGENQQKRVQFAVIGYIESRKGQDILADAIQRLPAKAAGECEFYFVGQDSSSMARELRVRIGGDYLNVKFTGTVGRQEIARLFSRLDVLICPSREDPMPTVAAEAMMHGVPCLLSDATGTAGYIEDGINGLVVPCKDVQALAERIIWCVEHRQDLKQMGAKARNIFEEFFSMDAFERNLMEIVDVCLE